VSTAQAQASAQLVRLMDGFVTTQLLYVAAKLGVADVLADGPQTARTIADEVGADPGQLGRMLRGLVLDEVLAEEEDGRFSLTPLGACLRDDVPGSVRGLAIARGDLYYRAAAGLPQTAVDGKAAFEHAYGEAFFDYLAGNPDDEATFQTSMAGRAEREAGDVVAAYDFGAFETLVDVGGGPGIVLAAILAAAPGVSAVLVDREAALPPARERLAARGFAGRFDCVEGDFFVAVPAGADAYVLSRVIHDWDDPDALRILATCKRAMTARSRLVLVEAILPERARDRPEAIRMDLLMLTLFGGARERSEAGYRSLLAQAGFRLEGIVPTRSPTGLSVIEARISS
jgi:hypothetical protein